MHQQPNHTGKGPNQKLIVEISQYFFPDSLTKQDNTPVYHLQLPVAYY